MNATSSRRAASPVLETLQELSQDNFGAKVNELWQSAGRVKDTVIEEVEQGNMPPACGFGIVSCITGQTFGYGLFHGQPNSADLVGSLYSNIESASRQ